MADDSLLDLKPITKAKGNGRNPYLDLLVKTPVLTNPTGGPSDERSLTDRFRLNLEAGKRSTIGGALESVIFDPRNREVDLDNPGDVADHLRGVRIRDNEAAWNTMRPARTPAEIAVAVGGQVAGTAMSPETFVNLPSRFVTSGLSAMSRVFRAGVSGAAINTLIDPVVQALRMKAGLQEEYSPTQTAWSAVFGLTLPAGVQGGIEAVSPRFVPEGGPRTAGEPGGATPPRPAAPAPPEPAAVTPLEITVPVDVPGRTPAEPPAAPARPENIADVGKAGGAIVDNMYDMLWAKVQAGDVIEGTKPSAILQVAKSIRDRGGLQSPEEFRTMVRDFTAVNSRGDERQAALRAIVDKYTPAIPPRADQVQAPAAPEMAEDIAGALPSETTIPTKIVDDLDTKIDALEAPDNSLSVETPEGRLQSALAAARKPFLTSFDESRERIGWAIEGGRPDIAEIIVARHERRASEALSEPGVPKDSPRFEEIESGLRQDKERERQEAAQLREFLSSRTSPDTAALTSVVAEARAPEPKPVPAFTPETAPTVGPTPNVRAGTFVFNAEDLNVDAETFQFKSEGDAEGVTPILRGVTKWDPAAAGQVIVWQRNDGTLFVGDGHQRAGLAKRLIASGDETDIGIPGILYRESDGFSAEDVMIIAAIKNIKEGSGNLLDAAKILRLEPERVREIEEIGRTQTRQAVALTRLSDEVWRMAVNDVIDARDAAIIGRILPDDPVMQEAAAKAIVRMKPANESEAEILVRRVRESELVKSENAAQGSLLADFDTPDSTVVEEVRIVARAVKTLSKDKNIMRRVAANADSIERVGSTIARQETMSAADEAGALARIVESVAFSRGEVRDALLELSKELKNGSRSIGDAVEAFIVALRRAETVSSKRGGPGGGGRPADASGGQDEAGPGLFGAAPQRQAETPPVAEPPAGEPIKVGSGDLLQSQSGRPLAPVPKLDFSTEGKTKNSLKRIDGWLVDEAIKEADGAGNDFVLTQMRGLDPKALSPADRDAANLVIFGNAEGATKAAVLPPGERPMMPAKPSLAEINRDLHERVSRLKAEIDAALADTGIFVARSGDRAVTISGSTREADQLQITYFHKGEPSGHIETPATGDFLWRDANEFTRPEWKRLSGAEADQALSPEGYQPVAEPGADGKPQLVLPGAERLPEASVAQRRADAPMRPRVAQKREAGPLFDDGSRQMDLMDLVRAAEGKGRELPFSQSLRGRPLRGDVGRPDAGVPVAAATPQAERLRDISDQMADTLGVPVRQGRIQTAGALGVYKDPAGVVRLKELDAFEVLAHEGGHALHLLPANRPRLDAMIDTHAIEVERLAYAGAAPGSEREEGFAEWFRLWLTNRGYAQREAPAFTAEFEEWLGRERPDVQSGLNSVQAAYRDWLQAPSKDVLTGDLVSSGAPPITTRIGRALETDRTPSGESLMSLMGRFYTWTIDRLHPVNRSVSALLKIHQRNTGQRLDLKAASDPYKLLRLASSAHQAGHIDLINGVVPYRRLDPEGPSVAEALELAIGRNWFGNWRSDEMIDFGGYLVARRSIIEFERFLAGEVPNPPGKLTMGDYRQAVADYEAAFPSFRPAAEMIYEWNRNLLQKKFDSGLVSLSYFEKALEKPDYVPLRRDFSEKIEELIRPAGPGGTNRQNIMKQYRGSLRSVINPIESMMSEAYSVAAIIARNDAIAALADLAVKAGPGGGAIAEHIPTKQLKGFDVDVLDALRIAGKDAGLDRAELDDLILAASERLDSEDVIATIFRAVDAQEKGEPIVYYWRGGQRLGLRLADKRFGKDLYEAVTQIGTEQSNWMINLLAVPARAMRMGITTSPDFLLANYLRDQIAAFVLNTKFIPFLSGARGMVDEIGQTRAARLYAQAGGMMGGANVASLDQARIGRNINALRKKGYTIKRLKDPRELLKLTEISETGTRVALFRQYFDTARKQGLSEYEAVIEAAFQARDFMDFGRHGSKMLFARRIVTFLNASLQGTDKELRVLVGDMAPLAKVFRGETLTASERQLVGRSTQAWAKLAAISALGMTYTALYRDDPEWQQASEYLRSTHWMFKTPGGDWAVMPKPYGFLASVINLTERMAEGLATDDPTWADKWIRSWAYTLAVPVEPAGLMVPAEIGFNYDTFREKPIVQQWDLGLEPWQQFYDYTSEFSKAVGKAINVSPAKIDHLIVGWTGSWGRNALNASNQLFDAQRRSDALYDWPVTGRFVKNLARGSDATDKFYGLVSETSGRLERKNNAHKEMVSRGQEDEASKFYGTLKDDEKVWVSLNQMETADEKRIHPLRRASDILRVYSGMRKDIANRNVVSILGKRKIDVNATVATAINDQLGRAATGETRNAMIVIGEPGWAGREIMDTETYLSAVRQLAPEIADEIEDRLNKAKVLPFEGVKNVWPELRERLLRDGKDAFILDLRADALSAIDRWAPWREPEIQRDPLGMPTGVRRGQRTGAVIRGGDNRISGLAGPDGKMIAEVRGRDPKTGRVNKVRRASREREVRRDEDGRVAQLA